MPNNIVERAIHYTLRHDKVQAQVLPPAHKDKCTNKQLQALKNFERLRPVLHTAYFSGISVCVMALQS
jgi:hypothetical protein